MIFFDTETTGLITNEALPLGQQPRIIEIGAVKTNDVGKVRGKFECRLNPGCALEPVITKITGLTDVDLKDAPPFIEIYGALAEFFIGERHWLAHNARFDLMMLVFELRRVDKHLAFPFPPLMTNTQVKWRGKLPNWAKVVKGEAFVQEHRALSDAMLLRECWFSGVTDESNV